LLVMLAMLGRGDDGYDFVLSSPAESK
jgi:hypothetical protein